MKKIWLLAFFLGVITGLINAQSAWRPGEMQVVVPVDQPQITRFIDLITTFKLNTDPSPGFIRCYLTPAEETFLKEAGIIYETEIADLNAWSASFGTRGVPQGYYTVEELNGIADSLALNFPEICTLQNLGTATGFYQLKALKISDNSALDENEAEVLFDGGIHGDEIGGPENMIRLARDLCLGYGTDELITYLVNNREIWIYYCVNPYGRANMTRYNGNDVDINRDCGYMWNAEGNSPSAFSQPETKVYRNLLTENQFAIHCSYHSGTEYISYPWSYRGDTTPDNQFHDFLASQYADYSGYSSIPYGQGYTGMYAINGSTKDFGYGAVGAISWSVEISLSKQPAASQIVPYYLKNKQSMLMMADYAGWGIEGVITDAVSGNPIPATIIVNNFYPVNNDPVVGDFHKFLNMGTYQVRIEANGYESRTFSNVFIDQAGSAVLNAAMNRAPGTFAKRIITCRIPNNNFNDEGYTPAALGPPDNIKYSLGRMGYAIFDMGDTITDAGGIEFIIYENDNSPEGYQLLAGQTMDGPWISLGSAIGNHEFDLAVTGLPWARFLKIIDDGDGQSQVADAGFDLDALEGIVHPPLSDSTGLISGIVYSQIFLEPLAGATVTCGDFITVTDNGGAFIIRADTGMVEICAEKWESFHYGCDSVYVSPGDTTFHDMYLPIAEGITNYNENRDSFRLWPNPADEFTNIILGREGEIRGFELFSSDGRPLRCNISLFGTKGLTLQTACLRPGVYFVTLLTETQTSTLKLLILK